LSPSYRLCLLLTGSCLTVNKINPHFSLTSTSIFTDIYFSGSYTSTLDTDNARYLDRLTAPVSNRYVYFIRVLLKCTYTCTPVPLHDHSAIHLSVTVLRQFSRPFKYNHVWTEFDDNSIGDSTCWAFASSVSQAKCTIVYARTLIISNRIKTHQRTASDYRRILCRFSAVNSYYLCK
jgi:hypothetical protein